MIFYNWKNEIIFLIFKEIDNFKYDLKHLINDLSNYIFYYLYF